MKDPPVKTAYVTVKLSQGGTVNNINIRAFGDFGVTIVSLQRLADGTFATTIS